MRPLRVADYQVWLSAYLAMESKKSEFDQERKKSKELTPAAFRGELKRQEKLKNKNIIYPYAVFEKKTGRLMGMLYLSLIIRYNVQSARVSYFIFNNYWKHGYGYEVVHALLLFAFKKLKLHRIEAEIQPHNKPSIALAKSLGMQLEGLRRKAVYINHKWHDHVIYTSVAEDFGIKNSRPKIFDK